MSNNNWHRLAPVALLFYFFRTVKQIGTQGTQALAPLAVVLFSSDHKLFAIIIFVVVAIFAILITALLQYWFFRFCIFDDELQMKYGVFKKQHRIIKFERVQNVNIKFPFYFKPFKLVVLSLETAGSNDDEASLAGMNKQSAQQLRDNILSHKNSLKGHEDTTDNEQTDANTPLNEEDGQVIATASTKELAYFGFINNQTLFLAAILAPFIEKFKDENEWLSLKPYIEQLSSHIGYIPATIAVVLTSFVIVFTIIQLVSIISAIVIHHNYRLTLFGNTLHENNNSPVQEKKLICQAGLFSQYQKALDLSKVQQIRQRASWQAKLLRVENLICHQIGSKKPSENLTVPARTSSQSQDLLAQLLPDAPLAPPQQSISKHFLINKVLRFVFIPSLLIVIFLLNNQPPTLGGYGFALIPFALLPLFYIYWRKYRFDFFTNESENNYLVIHTALLGYTRTHIPLYKAQSVKLTQTVLQKRRGLANLKLYLATGNYTIPFIPLPLAKQWFEQINYYIHTSNKPWY